MTKHPVKNRTEENKDIKTVEINVSCQLQKHEVNDKCIKKQLKPNILMALV